MQGRGQVRVAVNGYVIGKRVADAVSLQDDMRLVGVADVVSDRRMKVAVERGSLTGIETDGARSIVKTDRARGITGTFLPATSRPPAHVPGVDVRPPAIARG